MIAVDTNVLLYVHDPRDVRKQTIATELVSSLENPAPLWQVACEYLAAARKLTPFGLTVAVALDNMRTLRRLWTCCSPTWDVLDEAERLIARYSLSFWDPLLVAPCVVHGIEKLYSEDFSGYGSIGGVQIVNPFQRPA
jgi:predicted nucleic acid-binding protein